MTYRVSKPALRQFRFTHWSGLVLLACSVTGCGNLPYQEPNASSAHPRLQPQRSLEELLAYRMNACNQDKLQRAEQIRSLRAQVQHLRKDDNSGLEEELNGLMITSCEPASTPGLMGELLNHLVNLGQWPVEYDNLFDLLRSQQRAITQYNARALDSSRENQDLRQALQNQKEEFNKLQSTYKEAIKGIGDIEETLDSRKQKRLPPP